MLAGGVQEVHHGDQEAGQGAEVGLDEEEIHSIIFDTGNRIIHLDVGVAEGEVGQADQDEAPHLVTSLPLSRAAHLLVEVTLTLQQSSSSLLLSLSSSSSSSS